VVPGSNPYPYNGRVETIRRRAGAVSRVIRPDDPPSDMPEAEGSTPASRMNAVWELTVQCLAWQGGRTGEPRLQRSAVRIQRARR
jgi:hypothetical protein